MTGDGGFERRRQAGWSGSRAVGEVRVGNEGQAAHWRMGHFYLGPIWGARGEFRARQHVGGPFTCATPIENVPDAKPSGNSRSPSYRNRILTVL